MGGRGGQAVAGGERAVERGQAAAGVQQVGLLGDLAEQGAPLLAAGRQPRGDAASETRRWSVRSHAAHKIHTEAGACPRSRDTILVGIGLCVIITIG